MDEKAMRALAVNLRLKLTHYLHPKLTRLKRVIMPCFFISSQSFCPEDFVAFFLPSNV